uniref:Uncharacterized protein n=1 Tax=Rhizophora mucronata TaxID=61149 RepID=A0A2P2JXQ9_RHIMU
MKSQAMKPNEVTGKSGEPSLHTSKACASFVLKELCSRSDFEFSDSSTIPLSLGLP